jgi:hypothetical protein
MTTFNEHSILAEREGEFWDTDPARNGASIYMNRQKLPTSTSINACIQPNQALTLNENYIDATYYTSADDGQDGDESCKCFKST